MTEVTNQVISVHSDRKGTVILKWPDLQLYMTVENAKKLVNGLMNAIEFEEAIFDTEEEAKSVQKFDNPVWCDVWKFYTAIRSDTCEDPFYTQDYVLEKLMRILKGESTWHALIEEAFKEYRSRND